VFFYNRVCLLNIELSLDGAGLSRVALQPVSQPISEHFSKFDKPRDPVQGISAAHQWVYHCQIKGKYFLLSIFTVISFSVHPETSDFFFNRGARNFTTGI
jgi:hypothetical protein